MTGLLQRYRGLVCDLDGVVYAGPSAIPHAVESLEAARAGGLGIVYATNNASRPPAQVAEHLAELGLKVTENDVVNSSMAGAYVLAQRLDAGAEVLAVGGEGVGLALANAGLKPVASKDVRDGSARPVAVLQGYGPGVTAADLAETAYVIQSGATWVATNTDLTLPTDRGRAPGNGSLVGAVRCAVDVEPEVVGKPKPVMYALAGERLQMDPGSLLAIGDRLETDIEGAVSGGLDSVLVLTGVHGWPDAAAAAPERRPTYVVEDLRQLSEEYTVAADEAVDLDSVTSHTLPALDVPALRAALKALWARVDAGQMSPDQARASMESLSSEAAR